MCWRALQGKSTIFQFKHFETMLYSDENAQIDPIENTEAVASEEVELIEGEEVIEESEEEGQ
jgi:hypothetical protein